MNYLKPKVLCTLLVFLSVITLSFTSCSKDDSVTPNYYGSWNQSFTQTYNNPVNNQVISSQYKETLTFSKTGFIAFVQFYNPSSKVWIDESKESGTFTVTNNTMNFKVTAIGVSTSNVQTGYPTGTITMNQEGSAEFASYYAASGTPTTFSYVYSVSDNKLSLMQDLNGDGVYTGTNETSVFTKQ